MSSHLMIAGAGSGKTTYLIQKALEINDSSVLITTFTEANEKSIKDSIISKNGFILSNITVQTWFSFLLQHGVKPYQSYIYDGNIKGLLLVNEKSGVKCKFNNKKIYYKDSES